MTTSWNKQLNGLLLGIYWKQPNMHIRQYFIGRVETAVVKKLIPLEDTSIYLPSPFSYTVPFIQESFLQELFSFHMRLLEKFSNF